jgi:hypothetical protein
MKICTYKFKKPPKPSYTNRRKKLASELECVHIQFGTQLPGTES